MKAYDGFDGEGDIVGSGTISRSCDPCNASPPPCDEREATLHSQEKSSSSGSSSPYHNSRAEPAVHILHGSWGSGGGVPHTAKPKDIPRV